MKQAICIAVAAAALTTAVLAQVRQVPPQTGASQRTRPAENPGSVQAQNTLDAYCVGCHNSRARAGGVAFDTLTLDAVHEHADVWEAAVRKMRGRLMPPPGSRQPDQREIDGFVTWMEATLDAPPSGPPKGGPHERRVAGHVPMQRMTRTEYGTAVNDLLGIELDATQLLPAEIEVNGFDNIATALSTSPAFLDQYVAAARLAARLAVGESVPKVSSAHYARPKGDDQAVHIDGLPLGTRGGMKFRHNFPADGEYRFTLPDLGVDLYTRVVETRHTVIILVDGREVFRETLGGPEDMRIVDRGGAPGRAKVMERFANIPVQVKAGTYDVAVTFIERARIASDEFVGFLPGDEFSRGDRMARIVDGVNVVGPFNSPGVSDTPSRRRVFICRPASGEERACARRIAESLTRRAFRRPVTAEEIDSLMPYFDAGRKGVGGFDSGIEQVIAAVLVSPEFLYRGIRPPSEPGRLKAAPTNSAAAPTNSAAAPTNSAAAPTNSASTPTTSTEFPLSDLELASRLSFFLWSQGPDEPLLKVAAAGKLRAPQALRAEALRMLKDRRASSLVRNFALKWLDLDDLDEVVPDPNLFPTFTDQLRRDMSAEIESFVSSVLLEDRNVGDLLTANHTFLNERLARHYGMTSVLGPQFRRVTLADARRWGLLGKGAMLLKTSYGDRTSPVLRGAWVLGKLMGTPPTPPPPDVETDLSQQKGEVPRTLRARLESHRSKPGCNQCHGVIDPIGLAMENFDSIGRWRDADLEAKAPINASTVLPNGRAVDGPAQLRQALFGDRDLFVRALTEKLMMYAVGRELRYYDMPQVRAVVRRAAAQDYRLSAIVSGIVTSDAFRMQANEMQNAKVKMQN
jgi:mono/diheme cytochrome c family protein